MIRILSTILALLVLPLMFVNCGTSEMFTTHKGGRYAGQKLACSDELKAAFSRTYYPFIRANCTSCHQHVNSHASSDFSTAYLAFISKGAGVIDTRAINPHGGNNLDSVTMQNQINFFKPEWISAETRYDSCMAGEDFDETKPATLRLTDKLMGDIESTRTASAAWIKMTWDLDTELALTAAQGLIKGTFSIEVRYLLNNGVVAGLLFRNPNIVLRDGQASVKIYGIGVRMNGNANQYFTTYKTLDVTVPAGPSTLVLAQTSAPAMAPDANASSLMKVGIEFFQFQIVK